MLEYVNIALTCMLVGLTVALVWLYMKTKKTLDDVYERYKVERVRDMTVDNKFQNLYS
jgi:predicted histidine transporter YuiF (NhaC family)